MDSDRELLELAAKSAGMWKADFELDDDDKPFFYYECGIRLAWGRGWWNPIADDGDALRLAVRKYFDVVHLVPVDTEELACVAPDGEPIGAVEIWRENESDPIHVEYYKSGDDVCAATRRAIVRAAAEVGKNSPIQAQEKAA